jgi:hypothetical protein
VAALREGLGPEGEYRASFTAKLAEKRNPRARFNFRGNICPFLVNTNDWGHMSLYELTANRNCSGAPARGVQQGGLSNQNALYRYISPPHKVSVVDS